MLKLFIDDLRNPPDPSWEVARTSAEALELIKKRKYHIISFDHDLGETADGMIDTTMAVALYLEEKSYFGERCPNYIIHSANPVGRSNLKRCLDKALEYSKYINNDNVALV